MLKAVLLCSVAVLAASCTRLERAPQRYAMVIGVQADKLAEYRALHADPWEGVLAQLDRSNMRNFSIWLVEARPGEHMLFGYFEYVGVDFEADMAAMAADSETQRWWARTAPCQHPIPAAAEGQQWVMMEELFFHDAARPGAALMPPPPAFDGGKNE